MSKFTAEDAYRNWQLSPKSKTFGYQDTMAGLREAVFTQHKAGFMDGFDAATKAGIGPLAATVADAAPSGELPPLPEKGDLGWFSQSDQREKGEQQKYSADQMQAYARAAIAAQAKPQQMSDWQILKARAEGRLEALQIILGQDPENPFDKYTNGAPCPATGEYDTWWDEKKLRELLKVEDVKDSPFDRAEIAYIDALHERDEAKYARNFAENMNNSKVVRAALEKAGEYDLIAQLCTTEASPTLANSVPNKALIEALKDIAAFDDKSACDHLKRTGKYSAFDEPGSVVKARAALKAAGVEGV